MDKQEELLIISQFTLFAGASKGRRPSFTDAARPEQAIPLYEYFLSKMRAS
jgi:D-tyrosyl-tRNA(Tyr) deacylase